MKLRKLHIENYKMFKDFDISFVDENDKALPIVVLAGINGTGKTTLLESIVPHKVKSHTLSESKINDGIFLNLKYTKGNSFSSSKEIP